MRCPGFLLIQHSFPRIQNNFYTGWFLSITGNNFFTNAHTTVCCRQRTKRRLPGKTVQVRSGYQNIWFNAFRNNGKVPFFTLIFSLSGCATHHRWNTTVDGTEEPADVCVIELGGTIVKKSFCIIAANCEVAYYFCSIVPIDASIPVQEIKYFRHITTVAFLMQETLNQCLSLKH